MPVVLNSIQLVTDQFVSNKQPCTLHSLRAQRLNSISTFIDSISEIIMFDAFLQCTVAIVVYAASASEGVRALSLANYMYMCVDPLPLSYSLC